MRHLRPSPSTSTTTIGDIPILMRFTTLGLLAITCLPRALFAQAPAVDPLFRWLDHIAQQQLGQRERASAGIKSVADANRRKQLVREKLSEILGGLPNYNGPLNSRITGN